jgi:hypothetical protein
MIFTNFKKYYLSWIVLGCLMPQHSFGQFGAPEPANLSPCLKAEFQQLANFYSNTGGAGWSNKTNWLTNPDLGTWYGVKLTPDKCHVQSIELAENNLSGGIPTLNLPELTNLSLDNNHLKGDITNFYGAGTPKLQHLSLSNNLFTGALPALELKELTYLDFTNNQLTGTIPNFSLPNLQHLRLARNQLTGNVPSFETPYLIQLALSFNQLSGELPNFNYPNLRILWLENNNFVFGDMEGKAWLSAKLDTRVYKPQAIIPTAYNYNVLSVTVGKDLEPETFNWYKDGVLVTSINATNTFRPTEKGTYHCVITHNSLKDLVLTSKDTTLNCYTEPTNTYPTIWDGESVTVNGHTYTVSGIYYDTILHPVLCDEVVITNLTVKPIDCTYFNDKDNTRIVQGTNQLTCEANSIYAYLGAFQYAWSTGATTATINTQVAGTYSVTVTDPKGCTTTRTALNVPTFPDSILCVQVDGNYTITLPNLNLPNMVYKWYHNEMLIDTTHTPTFNISGLQHLDTGAYSVAFTLEEQNAMIQIATLRNCCFSKTDSVYRTIRAGTSVFWGSIARTETGIYVDTLFGRNFRGCDSIRVLNLTVVPCNVGFEVNLSQVGNKITANVAGGVAPYTYGWSSQDTTRAISIITNDYYKVTVTDNIGCVVSSNRWFEANNNSYYLEPTAIGCQEMSGCTPIRLMRNVSDIRGYTIRVRFDPTKVQPDTIANHTLGSILRRPDLVMYQQVTNDTTLVVIISIQGVNNISGNMADTLICLSWRPAPNGSPAQPAIRLQGVVEAANAVGGQNIYPINSTIQIIPEGIIQFALSYQGTQQMNNSTNNNPTKVLTGVRGQLQLNGTVNNTGGYTLTNWRNDSIQFSRKSLLGFGLPEIGGNDAHQIQLVVADDPNAERSVSRLLSMDVNGDGIINAGDVSEVLTRTIADGIGFQPSRLAGGGDPVAWKHFPKAYLTERADFQLSQSYPKDDQMGVSRFRIPRIDSLFHPHLDISCTQQSMPIVAILLGDADGSLGSTLVMDDRKGKLANQVTLDIKKATVSRDTFRIPVYASAAMMGLDCIIENYSDKMQIVGVSSASADIIMVSRVDTAIKRCLISSFTPKASGIPANTPLCYLTVKTACPYDSYFGKVTPYLNGVLSAPNMNTVCNVGTTETVVNDVKVFPNPTKDWLTVTYDNLPAKIQLFNITGSLLKTVEPTAMQSTIDVSDLSAGIYFVKVNQQMLKVVKQ